MTIQFHYDGTVKVFYETEQEILKGEVESWYNANASSNERDFILHRLRELRDDQLQKSDWTQNRDVVLSDDGTWQTYRQALRDLPTKLSDNVPFLVAQSDWPIEPGKGIWRGDKEFIKEFSDPVGMGTTSWIGKRSKVISEASAISPNDVGVGSTVIELSDIEGITADEDYIFNNGVDIIISKVGQDSVARKINSFTLDAAVGVGATIIPFLNPQQNGLDSGQRLVVGSNNIPILSIGSTTLTLTSGLVSGISTTDTVESYSDHYDTISLGSTVQAAITSGDIIVIKKIEEEYYRQERPVLKDSIELSSNTVSAGSTFSFTINTWNATRPIWYEYSIGYDQKIVTDVITSPLTGIVSTTPTSTGRNHAKVTTVVSVASTITEDMIGDIVIHAWYDGKENDTTLQHLETKIGITTI